jgi:hypothetical protein
VVVELLVGVKVKRLSPPSEEELLLLLAEEEELVPQLASKNNDESVNAAMALFIRSSFALEMVLS